MCESDSPAPGGATEAVVGTCRDGVATRLSNRQRRQPFHPAFVLAFFDRMFLLSEEGRFGFF